MSNMDAPLSSCPDCLAEYEYIGIVNPARALCECEFNNACKLCGAQARIIESDVYFCSAHAPEGFPVDSLPELEILEDIPIENVADVYLRNPEWPTPTYTRSNRRIQCGECRDVHRLRERENWNGTHSECPKCNAEITIGEP